MAKAGYTVHMLSDCITSYDKKKLPEMLEYYAQKGCTVQELREILCRQNLIERTEGNLLKCKTT